MQNQYYTVETLAKKLCVNPETVRRWIRSGKLQTDTRLAYGSMGISEESVNNFLKTIEGQKYKNRDKTELVAEAVGAFAGSAALAVTGGTTGLILAPLLGLTVGIVSSMKRHRNEELTLETVREEVVQNITEKYERLTQEEQELKKQIRELSQLLKQVSLELEQCKACLDNPEEIERAINEELEQKERQPNSKHESEH